MRSCLSLPREGNRAFPNLLRYHPSRKGFNQNMYFRQISLVRRKTAASGLSKFRPSTCAGISAISFATMTGVGMIAAGSHLPGRPVTSRTIMLQRSQEFVRFRTVPERPLRRAGRAVEAG